MTIEADRTLLAFVIKLPEYLWLLHMYLPIVHRLQRTSKDNPILRLPVAKKVADERIDDKRKPKSENSVPTRMKDVSCLA